MMAINYLKLLEESYTAPGNQQENVKKNQIILRQWILSSKKFLCCRYCFTNIWSLHCCQGCAAIHLHVVNIPKKLSSSMVPSKVVGWG